MLAWHSANYLRSIITNQENDVCSGLLPSDPGPWHDPEIRVYDAFSISLATTPPIVNKRLIDYMIMTLSGPECSVWWAGMLLIMFYQSKSLWLVKFHTLDKLCYQWAILLTFSFPVVRSWIEFALWPSIPSCLLVYPFALATSVAKLTTVVRFPLSDNQVRMGRKETILVQMS